MSCTLKARIKPKTEWPWSFYVGLRDKLDKKFGNLITDSAIPYLEGLRDGCQGKEAEQLTDMINALYDGDDIELNMEC